MKTEPYPPAWPRPPARPPRSPWIWINMLVIFCIPFFLKWQRHNFSSLSTIVTSLMRGWQPQCRHCSDFGKFFLFLHNYLRTCACLMRAPLNPSGVGGSEGRTGIWEKQGGLYWDSEGLMWNSFHSLIGLLAFTSTYPLQRSQRLVCCQISCDINWFAAGLPLNPTVAAPVWRHWDSHKSNLLAG